MPFKAQNQKGWQNNKRRINMKKTVCLLLVVFVCFAGISFAAKTKYEVVDVSNGGSIEGVAMFAGATVPKDETLTLTSEIELCGKTLPAEKYIISADKKIKNVVVFIEGITAGKAHTKEPVVVDNKMCAFVPHVAVGVRGKKHVKLMNSDPVFHNVHAYVKGKTVLNLGLPDQGSKVIKDLRKTGVMEVKCDSHPWMLGYVYILGHSYGTVTDAKGKFSIGDIPPGDYTVSTWHEALGTLKKEKVKVESGKATKISFEYK
jgi:plastocyanin